MSKQELEDLISNLASNHYDFQRELEPDVEEAMKAIDQYAYEYAERVIGHNSMPIVCSCDAPVAAMCICTAKFGNDLRAAQHKRNKELSPHRGYQRRR